MGPDEAPQKGNKCNKEIALIEESPQQLQQKEPFEDCMEYSPKPPLDAPMGGFFHVPKTHKIKWTKTGSLALFNLNETK